MGNAKAAVKSAARARRNKANHHKVAKVPDKPLRKVVANPRPANKVRHGKAVASAISAARVPNVVPVMVPTKAVIPIKPATQVKAVAVHPSRARPNHDHPRTSPINKTSPTWMTSKPMPVMTSAQKCRDHPTAVRSPAPVDKVDRAAQVVADVVAVVVAAGAAVVRVVIPAAATAVVVHPPAGRLARKHRTRRP